MAAIYASVIYVIYAYFIYISYKKKCSGLGGRLNNPPSQDVHILIPEACDVLCSVAPSCLTLGDPMDCSPPGSSVHGDFPGKNTGVGCHALLQGTQHFRSVKILSTLEVLKTLGELEYSMRSQRRR